MPVPKKKTSKSKRDMRRTHDKIKLPQVTMCPQCHEPVLPHHVCLECGTYNGKTLIEVKEN